MSLVRLGLVAGLLATAGLLACASVEGDEEGTSEAAIVQDRVVTVGRCRAPFLLDPNDALPPAEQVVQRDLRDVARDEVAMAADITATIRTVKGKRTVVALEAQLARDFGIVRGQALVTVTQTSSQSTTIQTGNGQVDYQVRTLSAPPSGMVGALRFGGDAVPLGVAVLQRETKTGRGWLRLGTHDGELVAVASGCTFDERAWTVLADTACEGRLFEGSDAGTTNCPVPASDAGAAPDAADAAPRVDAGADAATADAGTTTTTTTDDAGAPTAEKKTGTPAADEASPEEGAEDTPTSDREELPATPKPSRASSGCSTAPGTSGGSALAALAFGALGLALARRRKGATIGA